MRAIDIRRALFAVLFDAREPLTIAEIERRLRDDHGVRLEQSQRVLPRQRIGDMLRFQAGKGRVVRVARGVYVVVPESMSVSTRWRCHHWHLVRDRTWYTV